MAEKILVRATRVGFYGGERKYPPNPPGQTLYPPAKAGQPFYINGEEEFSDANRKGSYKGGEAIPAGWMVKVDPAQSAAPAPVAVAAQPEHKKVSRKVI